MVEMESWYFTPKVGIRSSIGEIKFGDSPEDIENIIGSPCYEVTDNVGGTGCLLRLYYSRQDELVYIFFCIGSLIFEEMEMIRATTKPQLKRYLRNKGFVIQKASYSYGDYSPELCMEFASSKDVGGETNEISSIGMFYSHEYWDLLMSGNLW
jgi:hypothetical protein